MSYQFIFDTQAKVIHGSTEKVFTRRNTGERFVIYREPDQTILKGMFESNILFVEVTYFPITPFLISYDPEPSVLTMRPDLLIKPHISHDRLSYKSHYSTIETPHPVV